ncbi:MAG: hypothetical protein ACYDHY_06910 [Acidiferrobacterales bacterium]
MSWAVSLGNGLFFPWPGYRAKRAVQEPMDREAQWRAEDRYTRWMESGGRDC